MGILTWIAAGAAAAALARLIPYLRTRGWRGEAFIAVLLATLAGLAATALDFGGLDAVDPRAAAFCFVTALLAVALYRMLYSLSASSARPKPRQSR